MSKELPYFKFFASEWISGDITLFNLETQGLFINICALYWRKNCSLKMSQIKTRFNNNDGIYSLLEEGVIQWNGESDLVKIGFLDEQYNELSERHRRNVENGKKGAEKRKKLRGASSQAEGGLVATLKHIDKEEDKIRKDNKSKHLFKNSPYFDKSTYLIEISKTDFKTEKKIDYGAYWYSMEDYSEQHGAMYKNWLATARAWIRRDIKEDKLKVAKKESPTKNGKRVYENDWRDLND